MDSNDSIPPTIGVGPADIVGCIKASLKSQGLERTLSDFEGMEHLLSRLPIWTEVKLAAEDLFANERERREELEMARARAAATNVYQVLPSAQMGVSTDGGHVGQLFMDNHGEVNPPGKKYTSGEKKS